ncbi:putative transcription factor C2H2 family [Rosa chinensis]|uniref:Putative transcription factor C2H2 family n=1 Tax=Rosa chinensis TaxID=74649 RepID=A0A2P6PXE5_ROSCH|nr:E3 ubiquitin ligase BIG BROTHER-related [Rosa chinensis]PRQ26595.1 putative transcription factor C2H2 family [Rosa chinensis]
MEGEEESKQSDPRSLIPFSELNQVSSDFILAMTMHEQEHAYRLLETIESESEEEDEEEDDDDQIHDVDDGTSSSEEFYHQDDADFFDLLSDDNGSDSDQEMEEDDFGDLDVDELTYEELLALGEFIGEEKRGLPSNEISTCLHPHTYKLSPIYQSKNSIIDKCVVCQYEYEDGEALAALPCEHHYHLECISNWLQIKKCCPICSTEVSSSSSSSKTKIV